MNRKQRAPSGRRRRVVFAWGLFVHTSGRAFMPLALCALDGHERKLAKHLYLFTELLVSIAS